MHRLTVQQKHWNLIEERKEQRFYFQISRCCDGHLCWWVSNYNRKICSSYKLRFDVGPSNSTVYGNLIYLHGHTFRTSLLMLASWFFFCKFFWSVEKHSRGGFSLSLDCVWSNGEPLLSFSIWYCPLEGSWASGGCWSSIRTGSPVEQPAFAKSGTSLL